MKMFRKKWLASLISILMIFAFMPISSFAINEGNEAEPAPSEPAVAEPAAPAPAPAQDKAVESEPAQEEAATEAAEPAEAEEATEPAEAEEAAEEPASEEAVETEDADKMPAQKFSGTASNGVKVSVSAPEGAFPEGTTMKLGAVSDAKALAYAQKADENATDAAAVDITFYKDGKKIQPKKNVSVKLSNAGLEDGEDAGILHVSGGSVSSVSGSASENGASFKAGSFSIYVVYVDGKQTSETVTITYKFHKAAGSEELVDTQIVKNGDTLKQPEAPEMTGHKFTGWAYVDGQGSHDISFGTQTVSGTEDTTVDAYPQYDKVNYVFFMFKGKIYYTATGEYGSASTCTVDSSEFAAATTQADSKLSGYSIEGWYDDEDCTGSSITSVTLSGEDAVVYGKGVEKNWVRFDTQGGSQVKSKSVARGKHVARPANPTKPGYTFDGWYKDSECTGTQFNFTTETISEDIILFAKWNAAKDTKYTVIYWQENADDTNYSYAESAIEQGTTGQRATYDSKAYTGFHFDHSDTVTIAGDGTTILNVYYNRNVYTLTFNDGKNKVATIKAKYGAYIAEKFNEAPFTTTYKGRAWKASDRQVYSYALQTLETMPAANVTFNLYNKSSNTLKTIYYYVENLDGDHSGTTQRHNGKTRYYSEHKAVSTYFNYITYEEEYHPIDGFTRWSKSDAGFNNSRKDFSYNKVSLYYDRNEYNIDFYNDIQKTTRSYQYEASLSALKDYEPERPAGIPEGYTFDCWCSDKNCAEGTEVSFEGMKMPDHNMVVYARWVPPVVSATVHASLDESQSYNIPYGENVKANADCYSKLREIKAAIDEDQDKIWIGWVDGNDDDFDLEQKIYANVSIYPNYIDSKQAIVVEYAAGGEELADGSSLPTDANSGKYIAGSKIKIKSGVKAKDTSKVFLGWAYGENTYQPGDKYLIPNSFTDNKITLVAQWGDKVAGTSVVYHSNYPEGDNDPDHPQSPLKNNEKIDVLSLEACGFKAPEGYEFIGWAQTEDGAVEFQAGDRILVDNVPSNNLFAKWKEIKYTVTWVNYDDTELEKDENVE
ncbi:MAG: InlB B-repeat-containing protein, partial [Clostridia bacterium]|nr:InlB B-repeat-containing protein [Clostridia bacterium]